MRWVVAAMAVTISDIAQIVGVSNQVVSKVLHGGSSTVRTSPATRAKIIDAAQRLAYRRNAHATAMRTRRFGSAALLQSTKVNRSLISPSLLDGLCDALMAADMHMTFAKLPDSDLTSEHAVPKILREWACDGLIINYNHMIPDEMIALILRFHLPAVWLNSRRSHDDVSPDNLMVGRMAAEHLLRRGHRDIRYVDYAFGLDATDKHHSTVDRFAGYAQEMTRLGLEPRRVGPPGHDEVPKEKRLEFTRSWLERPGRPTAVIAYTHYEFRAILCAALGMGLRVPQDLSVVLVNTIPLIDNGFPADTVVLPEEQLASIAVKMLLRKIAEPRETLPSQIVAPTLAEGQTVAPAPG